MKNFQKITRAVMLLIFAVAVISSYSQTATYSCVAKNDTLLNPREYQFEVYIKQTGTTNFYILTYQLSFKIINVAQIINGGTLSASYIAGTSQLTNGSYDYSPNSMSLSTVGGSTYLKINGPAPQLCAMLIPTTEIRLGTFKITNTEDFGQSSMDIILWNAVPATTSVYAMNPLDSCGTNSKITDINSHSINFTFPVLNKPVSILDMTGGGTYCPSGPGVDVGLSGSETGVEYQLYQNGNPTGSPVAGTGFPISFGLQLAGTYTCIASRIASYLSDTMNGSVISSIGNPVAVIAGNFSVCNGGQDEIYSTSSGMTDYIWTVNGGTIVSGAGTSSITVDWGGAPPADISVSYDDNGCDVQSPVSDIIFRDIPVVTAGPESPMPAICSGKSAEIYANGAVSYTWSPATGLSSTDGTLIMASPATTTVYTVTGTNSVGCSNTANITVTVNQNPSLTVTTFSSLNICSGGSVQLTAGGGVDYSWTPSAGLSDTTGTTVTASPAATTTYTVTEINASGCTDTASITVNVNPSVNLTVTPDKTICSGALLPLSADGAETYLWLPSAGLSASTGANVTASPAFTTVYTVTGTSGSCSASANVTVTVAASVTVSVTSSQSLCEGSSLPLTAGGAVDYTWTPATGLSSTTGSTVTASPNTTVIYTVTGVSGGCTNTANLTLTVNPKPDVTASANQNMCAGSSVPLTVSGANSYNWSPAEGLSVTTGSAVTASPQQTTTYIITGTDVQGCTDTANIAVTVYPYPDVRVLSEPGAHDSITLCAGDTVKLFALGAATYMWSPATGLSQSTGAEVLAFPAVSAVYSVSGTDGYGCVNSSDISVTVINCNKNLSPAGISDNVRIYPNPANEILYVDPGTESKYGHCKIYSVLGTVIIDKIITENKFQIDVRELAKGPYLLRIEEASGITVKFFVKE